MAKEVDGIVRWNTTYSQSAESKQQSCPDGMMNLTLKGYNIPFQLFRFAWFEVSSRIELASQVWKSVCSRDFQLLDKSSFNTSETLRKLGALRKSLWIRSKIVPTREVCTGIMREVLRTSLRSQIGPDRLGNRSSLENGTQTLSAVIEHRTYHIYGYLR